jgi:DinB superfamily
MHLTIGRPQNDEAASYYFNYINKISGDDPLAALERQLGEYLAEFAQISEQKSLHRYAPEKWSIREVLNHVSDTERVFASRALWFARGVSNCPAQLRANRRRFRSGGGPNLLGSPCGGVPLRSFSDPLTF